MRGGFLRAVLTLLGQGEGRGRKGGLSLLSCQRLGDQLGRSDSPLIPQAGGAGGDPSPRVPFSSYNSSELLQYQRQEG